MGIWNGKLVAHTGIIQFPFRKGWKRVHRLVVLPDYQGIGIGTKFITSIAKEYMKRELNVSLITTTPALVHALKKHRNWPLVRYGRAKSSYKKFDELYNKKSGHIENKKSSGRITYSFEYKK